MSESVKRKTYECVPKNDDECDGCYYYKQPRESKNDGCPRKLNPEYREREWEF